MGIRVILDSLDRKNPEDNPKRDPNPYETGSKYVKDLIPDNLNGTETQTETRTETKTETQTEFIYRVNFEAGKGQNNLQIYSLASAFELKLVII